MRILSLKNLIYKEVSTEPEHWDSVLLKVGYILEPQKSVAAHFSMLYQVDVDYKFHDEDSLLELAFTEDDKCMSKSWRTGRPSWIFSLTNPLLIGYISL